MTAYQCTLPEVHKERQHGEESDCCRFEPYLAQAGAGSSEQPLKQQRHCSAQLILA